MQADLVFGMMSGEIDDLSADVARIGMMFVNAYMLGKPGEPWILVDTGMTGFSDRIAQAAVERFGGGTRPAAIVLTHGHPDHVGSALDLATRWDVPIYVHPMERPFVTGQSDYPPQDPTVGGAMAFVSRFITLSRVDLGDHVRTLPDDGTVPGVDGWRWIHTPGHTPGHVSLYRDRDRCLIAGDAFATVDLDSWASMLTFDEQFSRPATTFTPDWLSAQRSVAELAALAPRIVGAGHGLPVYGTPAAAGLRDLASNFPVPRHGRYVGKPARYDDQGVIAVPPPVPDTLTRKIGLNAAAVGALALGAVRARSR